MATNYYFPLLFVHPEQKLGNELVGSFQLSQRKWTTSIFDLASLYSKHKVHLPYQLMDVLLEHCNCELTVLGEESLNAAVEAFEYFRLGLYVAGASPFLCPFITSHSINEYSGINDRSVESLRKKMPTDMQSGPSISDIQFEAWPLELSLQYIVLKERTVLSGALMAAAARFAFQWRGLTRRFPSLATVGYAASSAPKLLSTDQSLLHIWSGIESLFPTITSEVTYRLSINLAQLCSPSANRVETLRRIKSAYGTRSKVAHGATKEISIDQWQDAWQILMLALDSIVKRGALPSESDLMNELLGEG